MQVWRQLFLLTQQGPIAKGSGTKGGPPPKATSKASGGVALVAGLTCLPTTATHNKDKSGLVANAASHSVPSKLNTNQNGETGSKASSKCKSTPKPKSCSPCRFHFLLGECTAGDECEFSHTVPPADMATYFKRFPKAKGLGGVATTPVPKSATTAVA